MIRKTLLLLLTFFALQPMFAQDTTQNCSFSLNADLVSRYVWRGQLYSPAFNIQPYASVTAGQFTFGTWGSYALDNSYSEVDLYISWQFKNFGITLSDYCTLDEAGGTRYFTYKKASTPHALEGAATLQLSERFPLTITAATFFYGNDLDLDSKNYYSTYFELSYPFSKKGYDFNCFAGGTPAEGLYGTKAGLVNVGFSAQKSIKVTDSFELPVSVQLAANPLSDYIFLVFSLTL